MIRRLAYKPFFLGLAALAAISLLAALLLGPVSLSPSQLWQALANPGADSQQAGLIIWQIRLPRALLALLVGACLALGGAAMQGLFRNPLADPSLIGVSAGAALGASAVIVAGAAVLGIGEWFSLSLVTLAAFIGGAGATLLVYRLAANPLGTSVATMLLAGIAISALAGAVGSVLEYYADSDMLRRMSLWRMGGLDGANWPRVAMATLITGCVLWRLPRLGLALNALLLGESEARHLGINVEAVKREVILLAALGVGGSVALAGTIAFVGLVVPHSVRMLIGPDHRYLLPGCALAGATLLLAADSFSRMIIAPAELPIGVVTALIGAPFFISVLRHRRDYGME